MQFLSNLLGDNKPLQYLALAVIFVVVVLVLVAIYRFLFGPRIRSAGGGRARQPRLGVVDAYDLDRQRQLVLVRRDNVEHLVMIGGPNDLLIESTIVRAQPALQTPGLPGQREAGSLSAPPAPGPEDMTEAPASQAPTVDFAPRVEQPPRMEPVRAPEVSLAPPPAVVEPVPSPQPSADVNISRSRPVPAAPPPRPAPRTAIPPIPRPVPRSLTPRPVTTPVAPELSARQEPPTPAVEPPAPVVEPPPVPPEPPAPPPVPEMVFETPAPPPPPPPPPPPAPEPVIELPKDIPTEAKPAAPADPLEALEQEMARLLNRPTPGKP